MKSTSALIALTLALSASAAGAADLKGTSTTDSSLFPIPTLSRDNLSGVYVGLSGGVNFANTKIGYDGEYKAGDATVPFGGSLDGIGSDGLIGDVQLGYDYQVGKIVFGVFGGGNISTTKTEFSIYKGLNEAKAELTRDWGWYAGARVGYAVSKDTLVYGAGGYTEADFSLKNDFGSIDETETFGGYFGEAGIESRIYGPVFAKAYGRYVAYDAKEYGDVTVDTSEVQAMIGLTIKH